MEQGLRLLRRVQLLSFLGFEPFGARAQRNEPVGPHLELFVEGLHGVIVEGVTRFGTRRGPDERLMGVGEAPTTEVRHRIELAPDDIVQDPEALVLEEGTYPEDIVVGADHPQAPARLEDTPALLDPAPREIV